MVHPKQAKMIVPNSSPLFRVVLSVWLGAVFRCKAIRGEHFATTIANQGGPLYHLIRTIGATTVLPVGGWFVGWLKVVSWLPGNLLAVTRDVMNEQCKGYNIHKYSQQPCDGKKSRSLVKVGECPQRMPSVPQRNQVKVLTDFQTITWGSGRSCI